MTGSEVLKTRAGAFRHEHLDTVQSTNSELMQRARNGDPGALWLTASRQLSGRGRRGRGWMSERGNLYASLLLIDPAVQSQTGSLPLVAANAVERAIAASLPGLTRITSIKWPNDVLIEGRKVSGILLEAERLADGRLVVVIGIGVNVSICPDSAPYPVARLSDYAAGADASMLFARLFETMSEELAIWDKGAGVSHTVERWRRAAHGIGERITVNLPNAQVRGRFSGIDDDGMLRLETDEGTRMFAAGDVFFDN